MSKDHLFSLTNFLSFPHQSVGCSARRWRHLLVNREPHLVSRGLSKLVALASRSSPLQGTYLQSSGRVNEHCSHHRVRELTINTTLSHDTRRFFERPYLERFWRKPASTPGRPGASWLPRFGSLDEPEKRQNFSQSVFTG